MASVEIMLRFKEKDRDKKNKKAAFTVACMKFLLNFQAQKTTQERIIVERFSSSAPSTTTFTPETVHAVISVIHEKVYEIIQIEVSRKKLESSTNVGSSSSKGWWRRAKSSNQAAKTNIDFGWEKKAEDQIWPNKKRKPELCILIALKMKDDNLSDDKSSLQTSVLVFFILSTKSY